MHQSLVVNLAIPWKKNNADNRKHHHELQGTSSQRIPKDVDKLVKCMKMLEIDFNPSGDAFIVLTKSILPNNLFKYVNLGI